MFPFVKLLTERSGLLPWKLCRSRAVAEVLFVDRGNHGGIKPGG